MEDLVSWPEPGVRVWWSFDLDDDVLELLRATIWDWNYQFNNRLALFGIGATALVFVTQSNIRPSYARDTFIFLGDNTSAVKWVAK